MVRKITLSIEVLAKLLRQPLPALKISSKCSFTTCKLHFFANFCLARNCLSNFASTSIYLFLRKNSQVLVVILCVFHQPIIYAENSRALAEKNKRDMIYLCGDVKKLLKINLQLDKKVFKAKAPIHAQLEFSNISGRRLQVVNLDKVSDIALPSQVISLIFVNPAGNVISYAGPVLEFYPNNIRTWLEVDEIRNFSLTINEAGFQQFIIPVGGTYKISGSYFGLAAPNKQLCPPVAFVSSSFKIIN